MPRMENDTEPVLLRTATTAAEQSGKFPNWAYEARKGDDQRFVRSGGAKTGVAGAKRLARFPYVEPPGEKKASED